MLRAFNKTFANAGKGQILSFPDMHKLSEGLLLTVWTHWESFVRDLMIYDLATDSAGLLKSEIKKFRTKNACYRLAEKILDQPDSARFVEWNNYDTVRDRANVFLGSGHRFVALGNLKNDLSKIKVVRNAIAHKSDRAWESFLKQINNTPFSLAPKQRKGITPGRFITSHNWYGDIYLRTTVDRIKKCVDKLVP